LPEPADQRKDDRQKNAQQDTGSQRKVKTEIAFAERNITRQLSQPRELTRESQQNACQYQKYSRDY
jgi:hypothetical protein